MKNKITSARTSPSSKEKIREAYSEGNQKFVVEYIPPREELIREEERPKLRVCAYCRVSTDEEAQQSSYELQVHITDSISLRTHAGLSWISTRMRVFPAHRFSTGMTSNA